MFLYAKLTASHLANVEEGYLMAKQRSAVYANAARILKPLLRILSALGLSETELLEICKDHLRGFGATQTPKRLKLLVYGKPLEESRSQMELGSSLSS